MSEQAPLDLAGLDRNVAYVLRRAQIWTSQHIRQTFAPSKVTPAQYGVLKLIEANPGVAQGRVAIALGIERARLVNVIRRMRVGGLVTRKRSATDGRKYELHLTAKGGRMIAHLDVLIGGHNKAVDERLGVQGRRQLLKILAGLAR